MALVVFGGDGDTEEVEDGVSISEYGLLIDIGVVDEEEREGKKLGKERGIVLLIARFSWDNLSKGGKVVEFSVGI